MTEAIRPAPAVARAEQSVNPDPAVRWLLTAILVVVLVAWWHLSQQVTPVEGNVSTSVSSLDSPSPSNDPVQCWLFGVGIAGDKAKVDALGKGDPNNRCIQQALQGSRGEYPSP